MNSKYCKNCGNKVLPTMRMCPACGAKEFDASPPVLSHNTQSTSAPIAAPSTSLPLNSFNPSSGQLSVLIPAALGSRLVAALIDLVILAILQAIPVTIAYLLTLTIKNQEYSVLMVIAVLAAFVVPFVYHTVMPASQLRATYGKKWMGLKLVTIQGERLTKAQAFIRVLLTMVIPVSGLIAVSLSFGGMAANFKEELAASAGIALVLAIPLIIWGPYLTVFFNPLKQTLFDMIVKTIVVKG